MTEIISLDLNGTLINDDELVKEFWYVLIPGEVSKIKGISFDEAKDFCEREYTRYYENYGKDKNWISPKYWLKRFGITKSISEVLQNSKSEIRLYDDTKEAIKKLSQKYKIIISTEHPKEFAEKSLKLLGDEKIYRIYSSNDMGLSKLDLEFWKFIIKDVNVEPSEIVHIGDIYLKDYIAPMKVGMRSLYIKRKKIALIELLKTSGLLNE